MRRKDFEINLRCMRDQLKSGCGLIEFVSFFCVDTGQCVSVCFPVSPHGFIRLWDASVGKQRDGTQPWMIKRNAHTNVYTEQFVRIASPGLMLMIRMAMCSGTLVCASSSVPQRTQSTNFSVVCVCVLV